jgi:hypothetical protein
VDRGNWIASIHLNHKLTIQLHSQTELARIITESNLIIRIGIQNPTKKIEAAS